MKSDLASLSVKGEIRQRQIVMEIDQGNGEFKSWTFRLRNHHMLPFRWKVKSVKWNWLWKRVYPTLLRPCFDE